MKYIYNMFLKQYLHVETDEQKHRMLYVKTKNIDTVDKGPHTKTFAAHWSLCNRNYAGDFIFHKSINYI